MFLPVGVSNLGKSPANFFPKNWSGLNLGMVSDIGRFVFVFRPGHHNSNVPRETFGSPLGETFSSQGESDSRLKNGTGK